MLRVKCVSSKDFTKGLEWRDQRKWEALASVTGLMNSHPPGRATGLTSLGLITSMKDMQVKTHCLSEKGDQKWKRERGGDLPRAPHSENKDCKWTTERLFKGGLRLS